MGLKQRFSENDAYIQEQQTRCANNNLATFNAVAADNDFLRGRSVAISSQAIIRVPGTPFPQVSTAVDNSFGAAAADIGQSQAPINQYPDGGGLPTCFIAGVQITTPDGFKDIKDIHPLDVVLAFEKDGQRIIKKVTDKFEHLVEKYTLIQFADGHTTGLTEDHQYWTRPDFKPIRDISSVWHWNNEWKQVKIVKRTVIKEWMIVYNFTVEDLHCYIANGDACSNQKPI